MSGLHDDEKKKLHEKIISSTEKAMNESMEKNGKDHADTKDLQKGLEEEKAAKYLLLII